MKHLHILLVSLLFVFTACQDKSYGTQEISKIPIFTSSDTLKVVERTPQTNIAQRSYINLEFSAYIDPLSVSTTTVSMSDTNGSTIPLEIEIKDANLYILPLISLTATHTYTLVISSAITDIIGNATEQNYNFTYTCQENFWASVESGYTHSMALSKDGEMYLWGSTLQLLEDENEEVKITSYSAPLGVTRVKNPHAVSLGNNATGFITASKTLDSFIGTDFDKLSLGNSHAVTIKDNGTLWSWGSNSNGELGNAGVLKKSDLVQEFTQSSNWSEVSAGENYTVALKADGTMWGWGTNTYGQIGNSELNERRIPRQEDTNATDWKSISAGTNHTNAIKTDGTLWAWGLNASGELGTGDNISSRTQVQESTLETHWVYVSTGYDHTLALDENGALWAWGNDYYGQLGLGDKTNVNTPTKVTSLTNIVSVTAGKYFSLAVDKDGVLWSWGRNGHKQLGLNSIEDKLTPQRVK